MMILKKFKLIKSYGIKSGLAIKPDTDVKEIVPYLPFLDLILVMSVNQERVDKIYKDTENKIKELKVLLK